MNAVKVVTLFAMMALLILAGCDREIKVQAPTAPQVQLSNASCLAAACHGNADLKKTIVTATGSEEYIPMYVDSVKYKSNVHGAQLCISCHSDINGEGNGHGPVWKIYGGWSRFSKSQTVESFDINEPVRTRNYQTAAAMSCVTCHSKYANFRNSAHVTIFKQREAHIDDELTMLAGKTIGENYQAGNCNRCHASCATCHFESSIARAAGNTPMAYWDANQTSYPASGFNDKMSEFGMDWTTNVEAHEFRSAAYFQTDADSVCEACHTGFYKSPSMAYYWKDAAETIPDSILATNVKRHPQVYELMISGDPSYATGGTNTAHSSMKCADCHGGPTPNVHSLPGLEYEWAEKGDVQCTDCHSASSVHTTPSVALHMDDTGVKVACIGCHTFGLARDFDPQTPAHEVFIDPVTNEARPVCWKNGHAVAWYSHNWQTLNVGTGVGDPTSDCAIKCHYAGNRVGASTWNSSAASSIIPTYEWDVSH